MDNIFGAFRDARGDGSQKAFEVLQDRLAANASQLICCDVTGLKEVVELLIRLDGSGTEKANEESSDNKLQEFLRRSEEE